LTTVANARKDQASQCLDFEETMKPLSCCTLLLIKEPWLDACTKGSSPYRKKSASLVEENGIFVKVTAVA
jgi:hypothetical protein